MPTDSERIDSLEAEVRRLTELVNLLARRSGVGQLEAAAANGTYPDVVDAITRGQLIQAIKLYRDHTNCSLKEAKNAVEALARGL